MMYLVLVAGLCIVVIPFYWMIISSLKPEGAIFQYPPAALPRQIYLGHYQRLLQSAVFGRVFFNSLLVASCYTLCSAFFCSLAGFAFAKYQFRGRNVLFLVVLGSMMIPIHVNLIPLFLVMSKIGWTNTYQALIVPFAASAVGIFMMRQVIVSVPDELIDATRIDGCGEFRIYYKIILPMVMPGLVTYIVMAFLYSWNDFLWPLIVVQRTNMLTLPLFINNTRGQLRIDYGLMLASSTLATLPVILLFLIMAKSIISGALAGALKG
ncbi:MAG: carbohydrate ABC transporter permease [Planctomycetes bacterium]|nr:carbohydrate ABC transporter permease [Planctomycetota bacterium]